jgi:maleamate amidohydrolase
LQDERIDLFNTPITAYLTKHSVDTAIITGCTTSGCIRASVVDSFSYAYRTIVAEDCCGDGEEQAHRNNIQDMGRRYADIKQSQEVIDYLYSLARG